MTCIQATYLSKDKWISILIFLKDPKDNPRSYRSSTLCLLLLGNRIQWCRPGFVFPDYVRRTLREPRTESYIVILVNQHKIQNVRILAQAGFHTRNNRMESSFWMEGLAGVEERVFANINCQVVPYVMAASKWALS